MEYMEWLAHGLLAISVVLICASFGLLRQRTESKRIEFHFRPWLLAYGIVIFVIWSLFDIVLKMKFLE